MRCPSCGNEVSERDDYCWHCGHEFDSQGTEAETEDTTVGTEQDEETWKTGDVDVSVEPRNANTLAPLTHLLALFTWIFAPLVVFLVTEDDFVKRNAENALNWQITYSMYMLVSFFLVLFVVGLLTAVLAAFLDLVFCVVAAVKAADGEAWKYPLTIDIV